VSPSIIDKRRKEEPAFRAAMDRGYAEGRISVRRKQMQLLEEGSQTMAVWLGKQLLGQRDNMDSRFGGEEGRPIDVNVSPSEALISRIASLARRIPGPGAGQDT
jgi:hypothetical protein